MENRKLISGVDFVLQQTEPNYLEAEEFAEVYFKIHNYATFLKTPLTINLFVPAVFEDGSWRVLEEPNGNSENPEMIESEYKDLDIWNKALENVIFEGFEIITPEKHKIISLGGTTFISKSSFNVFYKKEWKEDWETDFSNIEALVKYNLTLTESKSKQLSLSNNI